MKGILNRLNFLVFWTCVFLILALGCGKSTPESLSWNCRLLGKETYYLVECRFCSEVDTSLLIDVGAFTYFCGYYEDIGEDWETSRIKMFLTQSQVILENRAGQKRLLSEIYSDPLEVKELHTVHCDAFDDWSISINAGRCAKMEWGVDYLSDLRVNPIDRSVRLHYVYKPKIGQVVTEFGEELYVVSNWIALPARPLKYEGKSAPVIMQAFE